MEVKKKRKKYTSPMIHKIKMRTLTLGGSKADTKENGAKYISPI